MKYYVLAVLLCGTCVFAQPQPGRLEPRPYVRGDFGVSIVEDSDANFFPGSLGKVTLELDPGVRFSVAGGAMFGDIVGLELETGWLINEVDSITGFTDVDAWLYQIPFLVNVNFQFKNRTGLTPFIGGGAGGAAVGIDIDDADSPTVHLDGSEGDFVFAWHVFGGLRYEINDQLSVGLIYKFMWTDDAEWDVDNTAQDIHFDGTRTHSISAIVSYNF